MELGIWWHPPRTGTGHGGGQEQGVQKPVLCGVWDACGLLCLLPPFLTVHSSAALHSVFQDNLFWFPSRAQIKGIQLFKVVMLSFYSWDAKRSISNMEEALVVRRELRGFPLPQEDALPEEEAGWDIPLSIKVKRSFVPKNPEKYGKKCKNNERQTYPLWEITQNHVRSWGVQKRKRL